MSSDVAQITALVHSYGTLLDRGDVDAVTGLFEHATWRGDPHGPTLRGSAEVRPVYEQLLAALGSLRTRHLLTNLTVAVDEEGSTASSHCYWTVLQNTEPGRRSTSPWPASTPTGSRRWTGPGASRID